MLSVEVQSVRPISSDFVGSGIGLGARLGHRSDSGMLHLIPDIGFDFFSLSTDEEGDSATVVVGKTGVAFRDRSAIGSSTPCAHSRPRIAS